MDADRGRSRPNKTPLQQQNDSRPPPRMTMSMTKPSRASSVPAHKNRPAPGGRGSEGAGAVSEDSFRANFDDCPKVTIFSSKDLTINLEDIVKVLSDTNNDWSKRVDALKKVRSIVQAGGCDFDEFFYELRQLEVPFQTSVKDLRSQVAREACVTISFLSETLGMKLEHFSETIFPVLVGLIQNSAKVMSTSGLVACRFILKHVNSPKLIPIVTGYMTSKSREIRRACTEFVYQIVSTWQQHSLERNVQSLNEAIKQGLNDADAEARNFSRKGFHAFAEHYPEQAELLFKTLDPSRQKQLKGDLSHASSSGSIGGGLRRSSENVNVPRFSHHATPRGSYLPGGRSTSEIDPGSARRAMQKHSNVASSGYGRQTKPPTYPMNSLPRPQRPPGLPTVAGSPYSQEPTSTTSTRTRTTSRSSISQPGSRSGSPTSRLPTSISKAKPTSRGYNRSHAGSREQSPNRSYSGRRYSTDANSPAVSSKYLSHSRDMERAVFDALSRKSSRGGGGRDDLDFSETSSVCSERSLNRFESAELTEALRCCSSTQWGERKEGLSTLQSYFKAGRSFSNSELKRICETFTRLFVDPHSKTFTLFLDVLVEFLNGYRQELCDWLYVLLTRLLMKVGGDLLASVQTKLNKTLDVVKESFPYELQYQTLLRYIMDPAQTPSMKVKEALLNYLVEIIHSMESESFVETSESKQAIAKVVHWTKEPKSVEVRKASVNVILALFSLNASAFSATVQELPKHYQDAVFRLLETMASSETKDRWNSSSRSHYSHSQRSSLSPKLNGKDERFLDVENVHDKLRETSAQIQDCFANGGGDIRGKGSQDSGIVDATDAAFGRTEDGLNGRLIEPLIVCTDEERQEEIISDILTEMSNHNRRVPERLKVMSTLKHMSRDGSFTLWDEHFKSILFIMLETTADKDEDIRREALKLLRELCLCQASRFRDYAELTLLKILEAYKDPQKEVVKAADDAASVMATHLPPHLCVRMLNPVIKNEPPPSLQAGLKILTKVMEQLTPDEVEAILPDIMPGVVNAFNHSDSSVRKNSVLCLVGVHNSVGYDKMEPFLETLKSSKIKLLSLYISKQQKT